MVLLPFYFVLSLSPLPGVLFYFPSINYIHNCMFPVLYCIVSD